MTCARLKTVAICFFGVVTAYMLMLVYIVFAYAKYDRQRTKVTERKRRSEKKGNQPPELPKVMHYSGG